MKSFLKIYRDLAAYSGGTFLIFTALITGCTNSSLATKQQQPKLLTTESSSPKSNLASNPPSCQTEQLSVAIGILHFG